MKVIIDPYRGGVDTGKIINSRYEKDILLEISKYMSNKFKDKSINSLLVRNNDISLSDNDRNKIINDIKDRNDLIIQNRISSDGEFNIIYPLRSDDKLPSLISNNLDKNNIIVNKYFQRRLPANTILDYYSIIRNTKPNETFIIEYNDVSNYKEIIDIIVDTIYNYLYKNNTYKVVKGDSLYSIAKKFNTSVDKIKELNNLSSNLLNIGDILKIPVIDNKNKYIVKYGDTLYSISKKYNTTVNKLKDINNLKSNNLYVGEELLIPINNTYKVVKGDSLYKIAKKFNTSVDKIKKLNNLSSNLLNIGDILKIPE